MKRIQNEHIICAGFGFCALNSAAVLIVQRPFAAREGWLAHRDDDSFCRYGTHWHERSPTGHAGRFVYLGNNSFSASRCEFGDIPCSKSRLVDVPFAGRGSRLFVIPDAVSPVPEKEIEKAKAR